jgi:hypothetical protein
MTPEELRAAAEVHDELGPGYHDAVLESFLDKVGRDIDARVDARLGRPGPQQPAGQFPGGQYPGGQFQPAPYPPQYQGSQQVVPHERHRHFQGSPFALAVASLIFGIPISAITASLAHLPGLAIAWLGIIIINVAYAARRDPHDGHTH